MWNLTVRWVLVLGLAQSASLPSIEHAMPFANTDNLEDRVDQAFGAAICIAASAMLTALAETNGVELFTQEIRSGCVPVRQHCRRQVRLVSSTLDECRGRCCVCQVRLPNKRLYGLQQSGSSIAQRCRGFLGQKPVSCPIRAVSWAATPVWVS